MSACLTMEQTAAETLQKLPSRDHVVAHQGVHSWVRQTWTLDMPTEADRPMQMHLAIEHS